MEKEMKKSTNKFLGQKGIRIEEFCQLTLSEISKGNLQRLFADEGFATKASVILSQRIKRSDVFYLAVAVSGKNFKLIASPVLIEQTINSYLYMPVELSKHLESNNSYEALHKAINERLAECFLAANFVINTVT
jgi:hypothetical protein